MNNYIKYFALLVFFSMFLFGCGGSSAIISTPTENIDSSPIKVSPLTENELKTWSHLDLVKDTIPGMSVEKAYSDIIKRKMGKPVIVAVIDSATDIDHEDLDDVLWTNENEIPNNGKDDDNNGYVDDIHGWNFIGDTYYEQFEYVRLLASGDTNNPRYTEAQEKYNEQFQKYSQLKINSSKLLQDVIDADNAVSKHLKKKDYTQKDISAIKTDNKELQDSVALIDYIFSIDRYDTVEAFKEAVEGDLMTISIRLDYHLNKSHKGRKTEDNPNDLSDVGYGNNNPRPTVKTESHGTHVSGIILAERDNDIGVKGVANNAKLMAIRSTPNGDEYDKDVALAIRYASDNGAKIINMSFGKSFSPHSDWVKDAILYAAAKDVLIVHGSGNDGHNIDLNKNYPNDIINKTSEISDNYITVGALTPRYGSSMVADYSNFGKVNVDVFAPGSEIYSSLPENEYKLQNGTSMSAPNVSGVAALIRSQFPNLTAPQVKQIIMDSGLPINTKVVVGESETIENLADISKSGKIVNAYNALIMASQIGNQ
ncbi:S8 family peptidase [Psychroserpens ponticola]|uniref:S8 family peptidase n=1 Tax=Psychroserpens ponticola TaxID=2932268 RepID=A0ABY7RX16_9FLAO|nr:S8 family peptidase [Psychroserpens ponticola]WCO01694.1 S8 family peptidase [Psychroserpens ponticola]